MRRACFMAAAAIVGLAVAAVNPFAGLFLIGAVLIGGLVLLVWRVMKL